MPDLVELALGLTHDSDKHVKHMKEKEEGSQDEKNPEEEVVCALTPSKLVVIQTKFSKSQ